MPKLSYQQASEIVRAARAGGEMSQEEMQAAKRTLDAGMLLPDDTVRRLLSMYMNRFMPNDFQAIRRLQLPSLVP